MIETVMNRARGLYAALADDRRLQSEAADALGMYRTAAARTITQMGRAGVLQACSSCASGPGGSCCFQGVEGWYDEVLILINLLLGVELPEKRHVADGCFFLGEQGCRLTARHAFCINYLCPALNGMIDPLEKRELLRVSGREILCGLEIEAMLRRRLKEGVG